MLQNRMWSKTERAPQLQLPWETVTMGEEQSLLGKKTIADKTQGTDGSNCCVYQICFVYVYQTCFGCFECQKVISEARVWSLRVLGLAVVSLSERP